jgi:Flp pilus assembly protein CpaB
VENIMSSKLFTTRQGTVLLGVIAAVVAGIVLIVYLHNYRNSVNASHASISVLVAQRLIQKGTPGDVIRTSSGVYRATSIAKNQVETGAIVNPATLAGEVALTDISPGQQLTAADFGAGGGSVAGELNRNQRAVVVSLDSPQEVGGQIAAGSHVDVWVTTSSQNTSGVTRSVAKLLFQDMYVLNAGTNGGNVTLRATPTQSGQLIYASSNDDLWLVLRPTIGTVTQKPPVISAAQVTGR